MRLVPIQILDLFRSGWTYGLSECFSFAAAGSMLIWCVLLAVLILFSAGCWKESCFVVYKKFGTSATFLLAL